MIDREAFSRRKAMALGALGRRTGFFAQYAYMNSVGPIPLYPAIADLCEAADTAPILDAIEQADFSDPFWRETTSHMDHVDACVDYAVVRHARPQRIMEIGSGRSTQVLSRAMEGGAMTCIDPDPRVSIDRLPVEFLRRTLQPGDVAMASQLEPDDILFIDSSHIAQPGTDVDIQLNMIFPALKPGVIVHVHDIFLPFAYPDTWNDRGWNEAQALAPWVLAGAFEIMFPTHWMLVERAAQMRNALPDFAEVAPYVGGSFWLRKH